MIKKTKYILISIFSSIGRDVKNSYDDMAKPKEILNMIFYVAIVLVFTEKWYELKILLVLYLLVYIWKIVKRGEWRKMMKDAKNK